MQKFLLTLFALTFLSAPAWAETWQPSEGHTQIVLWPGTPPDAQETKAETVSVSKGELIGGKTVQVVENVSQPTMTVYSPKGNNTGVAMVVFPGGGYKILAMDLEGTDVCDWLTAKGMTCILLKYRVPNSGPHWEDSCKCHREPKAPMALQDTQRAMGLVRQHAAEWHIDPHKIGVLGFSAGGHLTAAIGTHFKKRLYKPVDAADKESCRPDFAVTLYPGHMTENTKKEFELNPLLPVSADTPPTFLLQAEDDPVDDIQNSLVYFAALKKAKVPVELHIYAHGGHAFGLRRTAQPITAWPDLVETWLKTIGMLPEEHAAKN